MFKLIPLKKIPSLLGKKIDLGTIPTIKKETVKKEEKLIEKKSSFDNILNIFLDSEFIHKDNDWKITPNSGKTHPISTRYTDHDGDLILAAKVNGCLIYQIEINPNNISDIETLCETIEEERTPRKRISSYKTGLVEICDISYGDYIAAVKNYQEDGLFINEYIHYQRKDHPYQKDGQTKIKYCGTLMCEPNILEDMIIMIKRICKDKKSITFYE